jgi:DNA polymerase III subunit delta'
MGYLNEESIIGHTVPRNFFAKLAKNRRHHAFLLAGPEHSGKDTVARAFVADLLGRPVKNWTDLASVPDFRFLACDEEKKNIGVAEMRAFISHFASSSFSGGPKIGVISGAEDLSIEAANALLKTLEEPAGNAVMVLVAHRLDRLPETIKSRCQLTRFLPVANEEIVSGLRRRGVADEAAKYAAAYAVGRPGLAVSYAEDPVAKKNGQKNAASLIEFLGKPLSQRIALAGEIVAKAEVKDLSRLLDVWSVVLRDALSLATGNERYVAHLDSVASLRAYVATREPAQLVRSVRSVLGGKKMLGENVNSRLIFENIALSL